MSIGLGNHTQGDQSSFIVMIGPSLEYARGGMASVVLAYRNAGFFNDWPILYLETHREASGIAKLLLSAVSLSKFIKSLVQKKVKLLHVHIAGKVSFWRKSIFMLVSQWFGVPYVLHLHGSAFKVFYDTACRSLMKRYIRYIFNNAAVIVALSEEWRVWISGISSNENIKLIHNPVNLPADWSHDDESQKKNTNVLFLGKLVEKKGILDLLNAFATVVKQSSTPVYLYCGGDGDLVRIEKIIDGLGITDSVRVLGWIEGETKIRLLQDADVLVLPSYNEVLPMSILEAMAYGVPVVATKVGGIPDAVSNGIEGFLIEPGDVDGIVTAILKIINNIELKKTMRINARAKAEACFEDKMIISKLTKLYQELGINNA
jgi:glycosyltransferase involved in cell wall biosynthesis